jgi:hypothetical protein
MMTDLGPFATTTVLLDSTADITNFKTRGWDFIRAYLELSVASASKRPIYGPAVRCSTSLAAIPPLVLLRWFFSLQERPIYGPAVRCSINLVAIFTPRS